MPTSVETRTGRHGKRAERFQVAVWAGLAVAIIGSLPAAIAAQLAGVGANPLAYCYRPSLARLAASGSACGTGQPGQRPRRTTAQRDRT